MRFCNSHSLAFVSDLTAAICNCRKEERRKLTCFILYLLVLSLMFLPKANKKQIHGLLFAQRSGPDAKWENPYRANTRLINTSIYYQLFSYHALIIGFFLKNKEKQLVFPAKSISSSSERTEMTDVVWDMCRKKYRYAIGLSEVTGVTRLNGRRS